MLKALSSIPTKTPKTKYTYMCIHKEKKEEREI